ncbi:hypothetical protein [Pseudoalteromonas piscicida]|uniref:hypothetical protein n=1 Tax=Pseudoalteromonas piscicida TaxID=43662 RepID=UPI0012484CDC|nr:hypothetical protein [Pseudoalteromonas piscicida]
MALEVHPSSVLHSDVNTRSFIVAWSAPAESRGTVNVYLDPKGTHPVFSTTREAQFTYTDDKAIKNKMTAMGYLGLGLKDYPKIPITITRYVKRIVMVM